MHDIDEQLVARCQQGELAAFTTLFRHFEAPMYRLALTILYDEQDAQDIVQDAFLRVFEHIKGFEGNASFKTWLTTIVVNLCRDRIRRKRVRHALSLDWLLNRPSNHSVLQVVAERQQRRTLWRYVDRLEEKYRLPVILHYYQRLSCGEVAEILGVPVSTVYSRLNTARNQLKTMAQADSPALAEAEQVAW